MSTDTQKVDKLLRRVRRERKARQQAEELLDTKSRELWEANQKLERAREDLEQRVEARTRELAQARDEALRASYHKTEFVAQISHEFRTPLSGIIGYAEMLLEDLAADDRPLDRAAMHADVSSIREASQHLLKMIGELLDMSKIESGRHAVAIEAFSINDLLDEVQHTVRPLVHSAQSLELARADDLDTLTSDRMKVRQILINLISNALKFTPEGVIRVSVAASPCGERPGVRIAVRDEGVGMDEEALSRVFDAYEQADTTTQRDFGGTGLGLALCRKFAEMLGGHLSAQSTKGEGSTFTLELPLRASDPDEVA